MTKYLDNTLIVRRLFLVAFFMTAIGLVVSTKIIELALIKDKNLRSSSSNSSKKYIAFRGEVKDRHGRILASNIFKYVLKAYPKLINNPEKTAEILSKEIVDLNKKELLSK